jgi:hypothetical protein
LRSHDTNAPHREIAVLKRTFSISARQQKATEYRTPPFSFAELLTADKF